MPDLEAIIKTKREAEHDLLKRPEVTAVGVGHRITGGKETDEIVIRVYVERKLPPQDVPQESLIPSEIGGFKTDVIQQGFSKFANVENLRERPVPCGLEISTSIWQKIIPTYYYGTSGCFVRRRGHREVYLLTAGHVVNSPIYKMRDPYVHQARPFFYTNWIATPTASFLGGKVDAGIAQLADGVGYRNYIWTIGNITGIGKAKLQDRVRKHGRTTDQTEGLVKDIDFNPNPEKLDLNGVRLFGLLGIGGRLGTEIFALEGDSGAAIVNDQREVVGLLSLSANEGRYSGACPIHDVFEQLEIELADLPQ